LEMEICLSSRDGDGLLLYAGDAGLADLSLFRRVIGRRANRGVGMT
jgi:hypothetical protein